jgi:CPA1 family monovalent cation:H+ antiporter
MDLFSILAVIVTLAALFSILNHHYLHLPPSSALMIMALATSALVFLLGRFSPWGRHVQQAATSWLDQVRFSRTFLNGVLGFLLFAGALRVNLAELFEHWVPVALLAVAGTSASALMVGGLTWLVSSLLGLGLPLIYCFLFGALISPTDPIAVLHIFKQYAGKHRSLEATIAGESLLNDGIGVVLVTLFLGITAMSGQANGGLAAEVAVLFAREALGGLALGLLLGLAAYLLLRRMDAYTVEILVTLAVVMGGYALAQALEVSGPLAMIAAGILIGNQGRALAMSEQTRRHLDTFWELTDEFLNAFLFVMLGLEGLELGLRRDLLLASLLLVPLVLLTRFVTAGVPIALLRRRYGFPAGTALIVTWGGLRGGISVALALSLPDTPYRAAIISATYVIVVFAIVVQGLTIGRVLRRLR